MNKNNLIIIDVKCRAIKTRLGRILDDENLTFGQQMEIEECMLLAKESFAESTRELEKPVINTVR